uniref:DUF4219 domain-containing protein/UBN2 domain-containing protein n=1 Tax=Tanacetum cinerariifolium TaxID=118510 RepID=A0A6L2M5K3_TANCI|nr:DUF4219 domain-containing protein/UBN2 domain-containing protein [Tanacetum cinerariifolium]
MCKTAKDIWKSLLISHQGNRQVNDNKIDLLVQKYEQFTILEEESIDSGFASFNTIITSLKALDEGFSRKNYVRKFLRALHPKLRAKVIEIEESKDLSSLALDELIGNLKVHEVVMEKDSKIYRGKKERTKSISLKAKKESSDDETSTSGSDDKEYAMAVRNFKKFFRRKINLLGNQEKKRSHSDKGMRRKERVTKNALDMVIQIISLAIVQNHLVTKIKRPSSEVLGVIGKMTTKTKLTMKLVSWLNLQISANSLREMLNNQKSPSCKIGLGFDSGKASTSKTKTMSFIGSPTEKAMDGSTIKVHGSTLHGSAKVKVVQDAAVVAHANPQVVSAAKLPILNPNEFDLWKIRIEQYFLMTDYSLWEVILNGDSPVPTRLVKGVAQPVAPITIEQKLARKNELNITPQEEPTNFALMAITTSSSFFDNESVPSFVQSFEQIKAPRHSVQPLVVPILDASLKPTSLKSNSSSKRKNRKTCFVCRSVEYLIKDYDFHTKKKAQPTPRNYAHRGNNKQNASFTHKHPQKHMVPAAVITQSKLVYITAARSVYAVVPKIMVTRPRHAHSIDTKSKSSIRRHITRSPSPKTSNSPPRVIAA